MSKEKRRMNIKSFHKTIEELSCVSFKEEEGHIILVDELMDKQYTINETAYSICKYIDGKRNLIDICQELAAYYEIDITDVQEDVYDFYKFLKKNKIILVKETLSYKMIWLYEKIIKV